ncbi:hypothetical protein PRVXH_001305 [Proteinivorax hydrogeniformans]|uniref:Uncharacterized protein n=1 Tax=Proteinivorax hydrogeniformans TaxID=1826727 RepID=A0AAU8HX63_9FIRM
MYDLIDEKKLNESILSLDQYKHIKHQLTVFNNGTKGNIRDKLVFELAWQGLSNDEIKLIKETLYSSLGNQMKQ